MGKKVWGALLIGGLLYYFIYFIPPTTLSLTPDETLGASRQANAGGMASENAKSIDGAATAGVTRPQEAQTLTDRGGAAANSARLRTLGGPTAQDEHDAHLTPRVRSVLALAARLQNGDVTGSEFDAAVDGLTRRLTLADAAQLQDVALSTGRTHNARYLAVYMLSRRPADFSRQLEGVAAAESDLLATKPKPHSLQEVQKHFEEALHAQALAAIDQLNRGGDQERAFFTRLGATHSSPFIRKLARMGALGARQGQSLITQYINANIKEP
jgi:hypothetical protein